jgi:hypothetical protein
MIFKKADVANYQQAMFAALESFIITSIALTEKIYNKI